MQLRPTVKRDLSLFSVQGWQKGYLHYLKENLGFSYPIVFYYDRNRVNFYHTLKDFTYFKEVVTKKLISDKKLFQKLNKRFINNVQRIKEVGLAPTAENISEIFELMGKIMSLYIFVVSDSFVAKVPEAWESRHLSEGILYEVDEKVEGFLQKELKRKKINADLGHFLSFDETTDLFAGKNINTDEILERKESYIVWGKEIIADISFTEFCNKMGWENPEENITESLKEIKGKVAYPGNISGIVKIIHKKEDLKKVKKGEIIVSVMTNITYLPAVKKSAAVITDEGGVTCHAAIMARELKKVCITGTKVATKVLKDGDKISIQINENTGFIKQLLT